MAKLVKDPNKIEVLFPTDKWFFLQNSALSSVPVMDDGHTIAEGFDKYINDNGNTFTNEDILKYAKTYFGAPIFRDHNQDMDFVYGIVVDVALRKVKENGNYRYIVELLMAINREAVPDPDFVKEIEESGEVRTSMGVLSTSTICSLCGNISVSDNDECHHIMFHLGDKYITPYGYKSTITDIASPLDKRGVVPDYDINDYDSYPMCFIENSLLSKDHPPAYAGVVNSFLYHFPDSILSQKAIRIKLSARAYTRSQFSALKHFENKGQLKIVKGELQ